MAKQVQARRRKQLSVLIAVLLISIVLWGLHGNGVDGEDGKVVPQQHHIPTESDQGHAMLDSHTPTTPEAKKPLPRPSSVSNPQGNTWRIGVPFFNPSTASSSERRLILNNKKNRATSDPFITGDGFRAVAKFVFDDGSTDKSLSDLAMQREYFATLAANDTVFVQTHKLDQFLELLQNPAVIAEPSRQLPVRLITHNSDYSAPWEKSNTRGKHGATQYEKHRKLLLQSDALITKWYAQNTIVEHPKLIPIPIGIENRYNKFGAHADTLYADMAQAATPITKRKKRLLVTFNIKTNPIERKAAMMAAKGNFGRSEDGATFLTLSSTAQSDKTKKAALSEFSAALLEHQFVLAPHGHGVDTHRLWESLYAGCIPVTSPSALDNKLLEELPVVIVEKYATVTPDFLERIIDFIKKVEAGAIIDDAMKTEILEVFPFGEKLLGASTRGVRNAGLMSRATMKFWEEELR